MPPKSHTQADHIFKGKANAINRRVPAPPDSLRIPSPTPRTPDPIEEIPHIDITLLNTLITCLEDYKTGLDAVKIIIHDNQIEARQANLNKFNHSMEWLDNLKTAPAKRSRIDSQVPDALSDTSFSSIAVNVLTRWSWIDLPTAELIANNSFNQFIAQTSSR